MSNPQGTLFFEKVTSFLDNTMKEKNVVDKTFGKWR